MSHDWVTGCYWRLTGDAQSAGACASISVHFTGGVERVGT